MQEKGEIKSEDFYLITSNLDDKQAKKVNVNHHFVKYTALYFANICNTLGSLVSSGRLSGRDLFGLTGVRRLGGGGGDDWLRRVNRKVAGRYECRVSAGEQWNALVT